jgi:hypothetical protein
MNTVWQVQMYEGDAYTFAREEDARRFYDACEDAAIYEEPIFYQGSALEELIRARLEESDREPSDEDREERAELHARLEERDRADMIDAGRVRR